MVCVCLLNVIKFLFKCTHCGITCQYVLETLTVNVEGLTAGYMATISCNKAAIVPINNRYACINNNGSTVIVIHTKGMP